MAQVVEESMVYMHNEPCWQTKEGKLIPLTEIPDPHLRNIALFLMGFGYQRCIADTQVKIKWLTTLRNEWERRIRLGLVVTKN